MEEPLFLRGTRDDSVYLYTLSMRSIPLWYMSYRHTCRKWPSPGFNSGHGRLSNPKYLLVSEAFKSHSSSFRLYKLYIRVYILVARRIMPHEHAFERRQLNK